MCDMDMLVKETGSNDKVSSLLYSELLRERKCP
jgi:hypothetical protein